MFLLVIIILSVLLGALLCLVVEYIAIKKWYITLPILSPPRKPSYDKFQLPKELLDLLKNPDLKNEKETCVCLNLLLQFLFTELRDTKRLRKWVMKRMDIEFEELLQTTTTGKLLDGITVRDFNLGGVFPVIKDVSVSDVKLQDINIIEEVCILVDLDYSGGFQLAVDVDMVFGKSAYLSVKVTKLVGKARLQMTRIPYTHWTFAFIEEPVIEFEVESQFEGRQIAQLTSVIINQIRKSIRKKHTLPNYKIRYKPFFIKPEQPKVPKTVHCQGSKISVGELNVTIIKCSRLVMLQGETELPVYCSLALDKQTWADLMNTRRKQWIPYDVQIEKAQALNVGLTFKEELIIDRAETMIVIEIVTPNSPAGLANIKKGDVVISVNGNKVTSTKQLVRVIKQAPDSFHMRLERSSVVKGPTPGTLSEFKYNEDNVSLADEAECQQMTEEYINISINKLGETEKVTKGQEQPMISKTEQHFTTSLPAGIDLSDNLRQRRKGSLESKSLNNSVSVTNTESKPKPQSPKASLRTNKSDPQVMKRVGSTKEIKETEVSLKKTKCVKSGQDPVFQQEFTFQVQDRDEYLNVCVWCKVPEKVDRQNKVVKTEKDILLGHISIPIMDIALECMSTIQGDYQQTFQITPTDARAGASRSKFANLASHRGFDDALCHGDVTLAFIHSTQPLSKADRRKIHKIRRDSQEAIQQKQAMLLRRESKKLLMEGEHDFSGVKFNTATCCDFCHKKIWFKNGFQCEVCNLISHKKCMERCQLYTKCSKDGWMFKDPKLAAEYAKKAVKQVKVPEKQPIPDSSLQNNSSQNTPAKVPFLARFRRDKGLVQTPPSSAPRKRIPTSLLQRKLNVLQILERQRSNSLSNVGHSGSDSDQRSSKEETLLTPSGSIQKTRSSSSIDEMIKTRSTAHGESDTDSECEMNLMRYYEQQKHTARSDEMVVTAAKEMGRELYNYLAPDKRKVKLDSLINKLQRDIDEASEYRADLSKTFKDTHDPKEKAVLNTKMEKCDEKIQSLAVLMLHYCAGLQHCMEELEADKNKPEPSAQNNVDDTYVSIQSDSLLYSSKENGSQLEPKWNDQSFDKNEMFETSQDINITPELIRKRSETEYMDAKEGFVSEESQASLEFMEVHSPESTTEIPEADFERQLTNVLEDLAKSDDDENEVDEIDMPNYREDHFSSEEPLAENNQDVLKQKCNTGDESENLTFNEKNCNDEQVNDFNNDEGEALSPKRIQHNCQGEREIDKSSSDENPTALYNPMADSLTDEMADQLADEVASKKLVEEKEHEVSMDTENQLMEHDKVSNLVAEEVDSKQDVEVPKIQAKKELNDDNEIFPNINDGDINNKITDVDDQIADDIAKSVASAIHIDSNVHSDILKDIENISEVKGKAELTDIAAEHMKPKDLLLNNSSLSEERIMKRSNDEVSEQMDGMVENKVTAEPTSSKMVSVLNTTETNENDTVKALKEASLETVKMVTDTNILSDSSDLKQQDPESHMQSTLS